ncbi:vWA domain-containing protein [Streptomyces sp. NBC_01353]|uniref:vWA domain-containing protein n=1 Tax=Streptomyces sp. NBC_01353 TaxID=2903835 RepID=UPI002E2F7A64|nr:VWA domain-containing protein [Streptomyces sp. NBC_01353]
MRVRRTAAGWVVGALLALLLAPAPGAAAAEGEASGAGSLVMVLDSSGSMGDDDGSGRTRMEAARTAVGTVVDGLPDGHPTGLRVYGADRPQGCTDTRLVRPVAPLDRVGLKAAVAALKPTGDTPIGLSLQKAAEDLPEPSGGTIATRTTLLISDGEDTCGTPKPCEAAAQLAKDGIGLRIDTVGFQVKGAARKQLECIAEAGNGRYYDAPDADALARQLQRAARLSADGYRLRGKQIAGTPTSDRAPGLVPGQYLDTIGPGEKRYYAVDLDDVSTVDLSATAVPQPGAAVDTVDKLSTGLVYAHAGGEGNCATDSEIFHQNEGAVPLTSAVSRIPTEKRYSTCDKAGRYWFVVERTSKPASDAARWPLELVLGAEEPLRAGVTPAQSQPEYGAGGKEAVLPTGDPKDVRGGTGFNDARELGRGVWRDRLLPSQTLWYKVPVGWGQQLRYDVEFANEPTVDGSSSVRSYGGTQVYTPARRSVGGGTGEFGSQTTYDGRPTALSMGTVPVAWTNRYESNPNVVPVHTTGGFYIAVTLGAEAAEIARNPQIAMVLRIAVLGEELTGPEHGAAPVAGKTDKQGESSAHADSGGTGGAGWTVTGAAGAAGGAVVLIAAAVFVVKRVRGGTATDTRRGA